MKDLLRLQVYPRDRRDAWRRQSALSFRGEAVELGEPVLHHDRVAPLVRRFELENEKATVGSDVVHRGNWIKRRESELEDGRRSTRAEGPATPLDRSRHQAFSFSEVQLPPVARPARLEASVSRDLEWSLRGDVGIRAHEDLDFARSVRQVGDRASVG
jgi:hypothetical protein